MNYLNELGNKYTLLYIMFLTEQKYVREILRKKVTLPNKCI